MLLGKTTILVSPLAVGVCFLGLTLAPVVAGDRPTSVAFCDLSAAPEEHENELVKVRGTVISGFEAFALFSPECSDRIWIDMPDTGPQAMIGGGGGYSGRLVPNVTLQQFLEWNRSGAFRELDTLPWQVVDAPPAFQPTRDRMWRQFVKKVAEQQPKKKGVLCMACPKYSITATLIGRFEHRAQGFVTHGADGKVGYHPPGFGHMNAFQSRLVVAQVEAFDAVPIKGVPK